MADPHPIALAILNYAEGPFYVSIGSRDEDPNHDCETCPCGDCGWCCNVTIIHEVYGMDGLVLSAEEAEIAEEVCRDANIAWGAVVVGAFGDAKLHGPGMWIRSWGYSEARAYRETTGAVSQ